MHLIAQLPLGTDAIGIANQQHSQHQFRINVNCNSCWTQLPSSSIPVAPQMITKRHQRQHETQSEKRRDQNRYASAPGWLGVRGTRQIQDVPLILLSATSCQRGSQLRSSSLSSFPPTVLPVARNPPPPRLDS